MPEIGKNTIYFKQYYNQQVAPYIIYADFEALMNKKSEEKTIHEISGFSLVVVLQYENPQFFSHRGADAGLSLSLSLSRCVLRPQILRMIVAPGLSCIAVCTHNAFLGLTSMQFW